MSGIRPEGLAEKLSQLAGSMQAYRSGMVDSLVQLCRIPSVKGEPAPAAPYGIQTVRALEKFLAIGRQLGFCAVNLDNRAGYVEYGRGQKLIAVLAHLDVVPTGDDWTSDPFEPVVMPDRIVARGASDDKGPLVAALYALKALADEGFAPDARIRVIAGLDEETGSSCMEHYVKVAELPDAGFTPDADFPVIYAEKGIAWIDLVIPGGQPKGHCLRLVKAEAGLRPNMVPGNCLIRFSDTDGKDSEINVSGTPAHASTPWEGQNAIASAMEEAGRRLDAAGCQHPFVDFYRQFIGDSWRGDGFGIGGSDESGPLTLNAGILQLDEEAARLTIDIRYPVTWSSGRLMDALQSSLAGSCGMAIMLKDTPPLYFPADSALVGTLMSIYNQMTGQSAAPIAIGGGTYARTMPNIVAFGPLFPGDPEFAHKADEFITMDTLLGSAAIYKQALRQLAE